MLKAAFLRKNIPNNTHAITQEK